MTKYFFLFASLLLFAACSKDEPQEIMQNDPEQQDIERVTGYEMISANGQTQYVFGNPNDRRGNDVAYPVPCDEEIFIVGPDDISEFWIVDGMELVEDQSVNFDSLYADLAYSESALNEIAFLGATPADSSQNQGFDTSGWINGYYRIFYKRTDGEIYSQSIHVEHGLTDYQAYIAQMNAMWN